MGHRIGPFGKASGKVTFRDGTIVLGSANLINGVATLGAKLATGGHNLIAFASEHPHHLCPDQR